MIDLWLYSDEDKNPVAAGALTYSYLTYSLFASWSSDRDASAISTICLVSDFYWSRSCASDRRYFKSSVDFSDRLSWICDRSLLMITGRVVVGLPQSLFSVRWKYSCLALLAGISSFLRKICPKRRQRLSNMWVDSGRLRRSSER